MAPPDLHPDLAPLAFLIGTWHGRGQGVYPTIEPFSYLEEISFEPLPKPVLAYRQRTRHAATGEPLHAESGFVRLPDGSPELVISQVTGITETHGGVLEGQRLTWRTNAIGLTPAAQVHRVLEVRRSLQVDGDALSYELSMAAVGQPLQVHLRAKLRRDASG